MAITFQKEVGGCSTKPGLPPLFFDLEQDPGEMVNQATNPDSLPRVLDYAQKMLSWRMNHDEQTLTHMALTDRGVMTRTEPRH